MKVGVFTPLYQNLPLGEALDKIKAQGIDMVEIGAGGFPGKAHCDPAELLADEKKLKEWKAQFDDRGIGISALSVHGNPIHPNKELAKKFHEDWRNTVRLAEKLGINIVIGFSGCPGDSEGSKYPNWVVCAWPNDFLDILKWQWEEVLIPYWQEEAKFAADHGVDKIAFEMHQGFCVYNPDTLIKLREAVGPMIGANFDPSHLFWQGIDPVKAIRYLGERNAIFHFHAKDTFIDPINAPLNGVLDAKPYTDLAHRSWLFRSVGYGHDEKTWKDIVSALRLVGYDYVLSIEHEDALASIDEGFGKAVSLLKKVIFEEEMPQAWWV